MDEETSFQPGLIHPPAIHTIEGVPVLMDEDVARLFGVTTARLNEQVTRNLDKFGDDFAFRISQEEWRRLKSQNAISSQTSHGGRRTPPRMFTEHGVVMAASVLNSPEAVAASRFIVGVFVEARRQQAGHQPLPSQSRSVEGTLSVVERHGLLAKLDSAVGRVLDAIADPSAQTTVRDEARAIAAEGLSAIKDMLRKGGVQNEKMIAETHKLLKEAEALDAEIRNKQIEGQHRQLAYIAKQLRIVIEMQRFLETGNAEGLLMTLKDLGGE